MNVRASVAFSELTPRYPHFESDFKLLKLKKPKDKLAWDQIATPDYITTMKNKILSLTDKLKVSQEKIVEL